MTATVAIPDRTVFLARSYSTGASEASRRLQGIFEEAVASLRRSVTWDRVGHSLASLDEIYHECAEDNWDGYGATPIAEAAYDEAVRFLNALPFWLPAPDVVPEPNGDIGFEWNFGKNRVFIASVDGTNLITYAGLLGKGNKAHGQEAFDGSIPQTLIDHITRICLQSFARG